MSSFNVNSIKGWIKKIFPDLRKTQGLNLSLGVFGLIKARSGILSEVAREIPGAIKHKHRLKRLCRFVSNPRIKTGSLQLLWCQWVMSTFVLGKYVVVALDWTELPSNSQCLMAAIPFAGRAIPLLWVITTYRAVKDSQNRIEERLITNLTKIIPQEKRIILVADRGFGRASLVNYLISLNILFVLRVKADVVIQTRDEKKIKLRQLRIKPNQIKWFEDISYRADRKVARVNLAVTLAAGSDDAWLLVTNLKKANTAIKRYQLRFDIEEWFRDLKHELGLDNLRVKNLERVRRIIFVSAVSFGLLMLIGSLTQRLKTIHDQLITGGKIAASRIWFALRIIQYQLLPTLYWKRIWLKARGP